MCYRKTDREYRLLIKAKPNAACNRFMGIVGQHLVVAVAASPQKDKANRQIIKLIARYSRVSAGQVKIVHGKQSRYKELSISIDGDLSWLSSVDSTHSTSKFNVPELR